MQKEQTGKGGTVWQASISGPLFITSQKTCVNRDLLTILAQSCKPAADGMFAYSGSVNICFYCIGSYRPEDK